MLLQNSYRSAIAPIPCAGGTMFCVSAVGVGGRLVDRVHAYSCAGTAWKSVLQVLSPSAVGEDEGDWWLAEAAGDQGMSASTVMGAVCGGWDAERATGFGLCSGVWHEEVRVDGRSLIDTPNVLRRRAHFWLPCSVAGECGRRRLGRCVC